jgi:hypothetical protein
MDIARSLGSLLKQQIRVIYRPGDAFGVLKDAPFSKVIASYGILLFFNSVLTGILSLVIRGTISLISVPLLLGTFGVCILASVLHFSVFLLGGRKGFRRTLQVTMYGTTPILLTSWVFLNVWLYDPIRSHWTAYAAYLLSFLIWSFVLMAMGIQKIQDLPRTRSVISAGTAGFCIFFVLTVVLIFYLGVTQNFFGIESNSDAGKICNDSSECQGRCLSRYISTSSYPLVLPENSNFTGTCSSTGSSKGCFCTLSGQQNVTYKEKYDRVRSCMCVD